MLFAGETFPWWLAGVIKVGKRIGGEEGRPDIDRDHDAHFVDQQRTDFIASVGSNARIDAKRLWLVPDSGAAIHTQTIRPRNGSKKRPLDQLRKHLSAQVVGGGKQFLWRSRVRHL